MDVATIVLSFIVAALMSVTGATKLLDTSTARRNAEHLGVGPVRNVAIGIAEISAAAGLILGAFFFAPLGVVTAVAVIALMIGAVRYHVRARDPLSAALPALVTATLAVSLIVLHTLN